MSVHANLRLELRNLCSHNLVPTTLAEASLVLCFSMIFGITFTIWLRLCFLKPNCSCVAITPCDVWKRAFALIVFLGWNRLCQGMSLGVKESATIFVRCSWYVLNFVLKLGFGFYDNQILLISSWNSFDIFHFVAILLLPSSVVNINSIFENYSDKNHGFSERAIGSSSSIFSEFSLWQPWFEHSLLFISPFTALSSLLIRW